MPFVDADYDTDDWFARAKGMENERERGIRCTVCFDMRFERTTLSAHEHGFPVMTSSLGISRWKNMAQINDCGHRAVAPYERLACWNHNLPQPPVTPCADPDRHAAPGARSRHGSQQSSS